MRWTSSLVAFVCSTSTMMAAEPKDPKTLDVFAEKTATAKALIAKLDDDDILVRDRLTRKLRAMGRDALPALLEAQKGKLPNRVLDRVVEVLPAARAADFDARCPFFLTDKDRKYDHDLFGWNDLKTAVKDTKESRALMRDILEDEDCRAMLLLAFDPTEDGRKRFEKRWEAKQNGWWAEFKAGRQPEGHRPKADEPIHWMVAALLADLLYDRDYRSDFRGPVLEAYLTATDEGKSAVAGKGGYGAMVRDFARRWIERQEQRYGLWVGEWLARVMKFGEAFQRECLERQFEAAFARHEPSKALGSLAGTRDPKYIASFRRVFDWEERFTAAYPPLTSEIQVRDAALSMCVALSGQDPVDYGFSAQRRAKADEDGRYWTDNYFFKDGDGTTADEKRKVAFKKWAEWEKANPEKIKAKAPEKK